MIGAAGPHHEQSGCGVGDHAADVDDAGHRVEHVEVFAVGLPPPWQTGFEHVCRDVLDTFHELDEERAIARTHGRKTDATIAHHRGGDAVPRRGAHLGIPGNLRVVVRVDVDEPGRDEQPIGVECLASKADVVADGRDASGVDRDVRGERGAAGAVDDLAAAYDEVVGHGFVTT